MACFLDGVKCEGRVGMASGLAGYVNSFFGNQPEITPENRDQLKVFYDVLNVPFFDKVKYQQYQYKLDMRKFNNTTISKLVEGIEQIEARSQHRSTLNVVQITGPSGTEPIIVLNMVGKADNVMITDTNNLYALVSRLSELKDFIKTELKYKDFNNNTESKYKTFNNESVGNIKLANLLPTSFGGRRTKRHHTKRSKRSKRSKHTRRRKH